MNEIDRAMLLREIKRYARANNYNSRGTIAGPEIKLTYEAEYQLRNAKDAKRIVLNNEYGLLGNLLYKYIRSGESDKEVEELMLQCDERVTKDGYKKYGLGIVSGGKLACNRTAMSFLVQMDKYAINMIGPNLCDDADFLCEAAKYTEEVMAKASGRLLVDRDFVYRVVEANPLCYKYVIYRIKQDKDIALLAVKGHGMAIQWVDYVLRLDDDIVYAAIKNDGRALSYAPDKYTSDRKYVVLAIKTCGFAFTYADKTLKNDRKLALSAVKQDGTVLCYLNDEFKNDREIVMAAVKKVGAALQFASEELRDDDEIVREAVKTDYNSFKYASERIREKYKKAILAV